MWKGIGGVLAAAGAIIIALAPAGAQASGWSGGGGGQTVILDNGWTGGFNSWRVGGSSTFISIAENTSTGQIYPVTSTSTITSTGTGYTAGVTTTGGGHPVYWCWGECSSVHLSSVPPAPPAPPPTTYYTPGPVAPPPQWETWQWHVSLAASATRVPAGTSVTLTATANAGVGGTPVYIVITAYGGGYGGTAVASCGNGATCSTSQVYGTAQDVTYHAVISSNQSGWGGVVADSNTIPVTWYAVAAPPVVQSPTFAPDPAYPGQWTCASVHAVGAASVALGLPGGSLPLAQSAGDTWTGCFSAPAPGTYTVPATATGPGGEAGANGTLTVATPTPSAGFAVSPNPVSLNGGLSWSDQSNPGAGGQMAREQWVITDPAGNQVWNAPAPPGCACFADPGQGASRTYTATQYVWNNYGRTAQTSHPLTVQVPAPVAAFSMSPNPVIADWQSVSYQDNSSAGGSGLSIASEHWSMSGPGGSWSGASPAALPRTLSTPGQYSVGLTVTNNEGVAASTSHTLTVLPAPTISISISPQAVQAGGTATVTAQWSGWGSARIDLGQFGGGTISEPGTGSISRGYVVGQAGTYSACITGILDGQTRTACAATTALAPTAPVLTQ